MAVFPTLQEISGPPEDPFAGLAGTLAMRYFRLVRAGERLGQDSGPSSRISELLTSELERERSRIARDLHSGAGQPLAGIKMNVDLLRSIYPELPASAQNNLARVELLVDQALEQIRSISHRLYPPDWQRLDVSEAISSLFQTSGVSDRFDVTLDLPKLVVEPPHSVRVVLYRSAQECLANIIRHSGATRMRLWLREQGDRILLRVEDNGIGFKAPGPAQPEKRESQGIGLTAMREQIESLGGILSIQSGPRGTKLEISLPVAEE